MHPDSNRLRAIQTLVHHAIPDNLDDFDRVAGEVAASLVTLGVSIAEIREAMDFAILTAEVEQ